MTSYPHKYILVDHTPVIEDDLMKWAEWFGTATRHVAENILPSGVRVSTIFLGLDHSFNESTPVLFETMIFGGEHNDYQDRYATWDEAVAGHAKALALAEGR